MQRTPYYLVPRVQGREDAINDFVSVRIEVGEPLSSDIQMELVLLPLCGGIFHMAQQIGLC